MNNRISIMIKMKCIVRHDVWGNDIRQITLGGIHMISDGGGGPSERF